MSTVVLSATNDTYIQPGGDWWAHQNEWGASTAGTQSITLDTTSFPNGMVLQWNVTNPINATNYPEVGYGQTWFLPSTYGGAVPAIQLNNIGAMSVTYAVTLSGNPGNYDVMMESFITAQPDQKGSYSYEISYFPHLPFITDQVSTAYTHLFYYNDPTLGLMEVTKANTQIDIQPITLLSDGTELPRDVLSGTFDMKTMYQQLISHGTVSGSLYINGAEFGAEVWANNAGASGITINSLSYDWQPNGSSGSGSDPSSAGTGGTSSSGTGGTSSSGTGGTSSSGTGDTSSSGTGDTSSGTGGTSSSGTGDTSSSGTGDTSSGTGGTSSSGTGGTSSSGTGDTSSGTGGTSSSGTGGTSSSGTGGTSSGTGGTSTGTGGTSTGDPGTGTGTDGDTSPPPLVLRGGSTGDHLTGGDGNDQLYGAGGKDVLMGNSGNDVLSGGDGRDILMGGQDNDNINGGSGKDVLLLDGSMQDYNFAVTKGGVTVTDSTGEVDTVKNVEVFHFSDGTNYLVGRHGLVQTGDQTINSFLAASGVDQSHLGSVSTAAQQAPAQSANPTGSMQPVLWNAVDAASNSPTHVDTVLADLKQQLHDGAFDHAGATGTVDELAALLPWAHHEFLSAHHE